jgi:hypothetical protein
LATAALAVAAVWSLRAVKKQLTAHLYAEYTKRYQHIILEFPENINTADLPVEDSDEYRDVMRQMRAYFDLCYEERALHKRGYIDKTTWNDWRQGMKAAVGKPAFQQAWQRISKDQQYPEFREFICGLMPVEAPSASMHS